MNMPCLWSAIVATLALLVPTVRAVEAGMQRRADLPPLQYTNAPATLPNSPAGQKGAPGEPFSQMQLPLTPADSAAHLVTQPEFTHQLWAAEPDITKPLCMAWDERGRLWIAESIDYPNELQPPGEGRDRIKICEDTDGDGRADKFTIFAEKLSIPTGMVFGNGGLIVIEGGRTLFLKDNDGDGKADERAVLFEGWGRSDPRATASNLRYGLDNWIWGTVGNSGFDGTVKHQPIKFGPGVFRFKPDGTALEFVRSTGNNTWGLGMSEEGIVFGSTSDNNASWYLPMANRYYEAVSGWSAGRLETIADSQAIYPITGPVRQADARRRFTAGAGHAIYTARNFPGSYWNKVAFVAEPSGHLVGQFRLEARGSDFGAVNERSFLASDDEWTAPIAAEVGPDGALWVIDGYNYAVQPNSTPAGKGKAYETPLRDKSRGRIYRVAWTKASLAPRLNLAKAPLDQLVLALKNDNQLWRMHAQRLMVERGRRDVVPTLFALVRDTGVDEVGLNPGAIHALWTLHGMGQRDPNDRSFQYAAIAALTHPSAGVRRAAAMVLPRNAESASALLASLMDPDAQVRLAAFLSLAEMPPSDEAGAAIVAALNNEANSHDRWIPDAATAAAARHDASFLKAALAGGPIPSPAFSNAIRVVTRHYARRGPVESVVSTLLALNSAAPGVVRPVLEGLSTAWPRDKVPVFTAVEESGMASLLKSLPDDARGSLLALADRWGKRNIFAAELAGLTSVLQEQIQNSKLSDTERSEAARHLVFLADREESVNTILTQITTLSTPELAGGFIAAVGQSRRTQTGPAVIGSFPKFTPATRRAAVAVLLRRPEWAAALLKSIEQHDLQHADLAADHWSQLRAYPDGAIVVKARELEKSSGDLSSTEMEALIRKLLPVARQKGDAAHGREVFAQSCAVCHVFDGQGSTFGPALNGIGARPRQDILVDIIDPNRNVAPNYRRWTVTTTGGATIAGRLDAETATSVEVLDPAGHRHVVLRSNIADMKPTGLSLMPVGFEKLPEADLAALLEYLASAPVPKTP